MDFSLPKMNQSKLAKKIKEYFIMYIHKIEKWKCPHHLASELETYITLQFTDIPLDHAHVPYCIKFFFYMLHLHFNLYRFVNYKVKLIRFFP